MEERESKRQLDEMFEADDRAPERPSERSHNDPSIAIALEAPRSRRSFRQNRYQPEGTLWVDGAAVASGP